ncbi:MAG: proprotein convertase P-domain-containing protein, partial [Bacteroidota bacterium]
GGRIELSTANGGSGDNFTNTVFCDNAPASITTGTAPFTGNFRPEGGLYTYTCGVSTTFNVNTLAGMGSTDGIWTLRFMDSAGGDLGTMLGWSLEFGPNCSFVQPQPLAPISLAANNPAICGAQNVPVTAPTLSCAGGGSASMSVFLNGVLINPSVPSGGTFTVSGPAGSHVLRYVLPNCQERTQALTITDGAPPIITCPASVTLNLGPGACSTYYDYSVLFSDNCPLTLNGTVNHPINFNNGQAGVMFDIRNTGGAPINIVNFTPSLDPGTWPMQIYITTTAASWVGNDVNPGAWTLLTQQNITSVGTNPGTLIPVTGLTLQPGQAKGVYITSTTGFPINYTNGTRTFSDANLTVSANPGAGKAFPFGATFNARAYNGGVTYANQAQGLVQLDGLPSGGEFPIGTTVNTFKMTDLAGNMSTCSFSVTVQEYPDPKPDLTCNDLINISVDEDCATCINADDVLEGGPYGCYDDYIVELDKTLPYGNGPWVAACVNSSDIGKTYQVRVIDPETGNKCWGTVKIEDKIAPKLTCDPIVMPCNANVTPGAPINTYTAINNSIIDITAASATQAISPVVVSGITPTATVNDLNVEVEVTHTWVGDLQVDIESPNGTRITLMNNINNALACTQDNFKILFDDESSTPFAVLDDPNQSCNTSTTGNDNPGPPYAIEGDYQPQVALNTFDGQGVNGTWKVYVIDGFGADGGHIRSVKLSFGLTGAVVQPATVFEACCLESLTYTDSYVDEDCSTGLTRTISRKWTAKDCSGNTSTCIQEISLIRPTLGDVVLPPDYDGVDADAFQCTDNAYPTPDWIEGRGLQGYPWVFGEPEGCSIDWEYEDLKVDVCDGTYKIRRRWTVIDWCVGDGYTYNQIIKVMDNSGPTMACPANMTVSVDPFSCCAFVNLPDVVIEDNCSRINNISGMIVTFEPFTGEQTGMLTFGGSVSDFPGNNYWDLDTLGAFGWTPCLPQGTHTVTYVAEDDCGNTATCS